MNFYQQDVARSRQRFATELAREAELEQDSPPMYHGQQDVLTEEMRQGFLEAGILARPISATEYLLVYPGNVTIIMKG
jgi:hypothetical protein